MCRFVEKPRRTCGNSCIVDARNENPVGKRRWFHQMKSGSGDKREMEDFFSPPFFLSFPPLVTRLFFQGNIKCEFFFLGVFCRYFFEFRCCCCSCCCYRCWPSIRLGMIVSIQRFANVCPCLIECRGYTIVRIFDIVLFFLFFFFQIYGINSNDPIE